MNQDRPTPDTPGEQAPSDIFWKEGGGAARKHPDRIGPYRISAVLGQGGMGIVYLARQDSPPRTVALKVIRDGAESAELRRRFRVEAEALLRLEHPGIAQVYDVGMFDTESGPEPYLAMEHIDGLRLTDYVRHQRLATRERLALLIQVCHAVHHAHEMGIVHRDLKPGNILVDNQGRCKVLDFGLARWMDVDARVTTLRTDVARLMGTLPYMSPEQVAGDAAHVDIRSDTYALGVIAYELLVDRLPYDVAHCSIPQAARRIQEVDPIPLSTIHRALKGDAETIVNKALEKEPDRRYQSAAEFAADIQHYLSDRPIAARPVSTLYQMRKFARRNRGLVAGATAAFVMLIAGVIVSSAFAIGRGRALHESEHQRRIAEAVNQFLTQDLLASADPTKQPDRTISLREVLDRAAGKIEGRFADSPLVEASIRTTLSNTYKAMGEYTPALEQAVRALEIYQSEPLAPAKETVRAMNRTASLERALGRYTEAEARFRETLELATRLFGEEDETALSVLNNLALLLERDERKAEAAEILERVVQIRTRVLGEQHDHTMTSINNLALVYVALGRYDEAEPLYLKELDYSRRTAGPEHPGTLISLNNLAVLYIFRGDLTRAEPLVREVLEARTRVLGPDHPETIESLDTLGNMLSRSKRFDEALTVLNDAVERSRRTLGADHPLSTRVLERLAVIYLALEQFDEAEPFFRTSYAAKRDRHGEDHPSTAHTMSILAAIAVEHGNVEEAESLGLHSYPIIERAFGPRHKEVTNLAKAMQRVYEIKGNAEEAARWKERTE